MPRDGSGIFSLPANTAAVSNDPISSTKYNTLTQDLEADANNARPVVAGGTGANNAADARANLGVGAAQNVTFAGLKVGAGTAAAPTYANSGDVDTGLFFPAADTLAAVTGGLERWRLTSAGRLGIGTIDPKTSFVVSAGGAQGLEVDPNYASRNEVRLMAYDRAAAAEIPLVLRASQTIWRPAGIEKMRLDSSGNLLVGTTSLAGAGGFSVAPAGSNGAATAYWNRDTTTLHSTAMFFRNAGTTVGSVTFNDTATAYNTSSARWLKDNITDYEQDSGAMIDALKPRSYDWKVNGKRSLGFIADEFGEVFPDSTSYDENGRAASIDAGTPEVIATLVAELQSLRARVAQLEAAQ